MGVTSILCIFRLVVEGETGKEIPASSRLEFLEKYSANNFALSDAEDNTSRPLNRGYIADFSIDNLPKVPRAKFLGSDRLKSDRLLKTLAILSDTIIRKSAVDQEDLKPYWKREKRPDFSR